MCVSGLTFVRQWFVVKPPVPFHNSRCVGEDVDHSCARVFPLARAPWNSAICSFEQLAFSGLEVYNLEHLLGCVLVELARRLASMRSRRCSAWLRMSESRRSVLRRPSRPSTTCIVKCSHVAPVPRRHGDALDPCGLNDLACAHKRRHLPERRVLHACGVFAHKANHRSHLSRKHAADAGDSTDWEGRLHRGVAAHA